MKVLLTSQYNAANTYVKDIVDELRKEPDLELVTEQQNFWVSTIDYDIIHIQWPEDLFYWNKTNKEDIQKLAEKLKQIKAAGTKIVATMHNRIPHRKHELDKQLYDLVYGNADAIIHLGHYSTSLTPDKKNYVIFHPNYNSYYQIKNKKPSDSVTFLSFGRIRVKKEEDQLIEAFRKANIPNSRLIVSNSYFAQPPKSKKAYKLFIKSIIQSFQLYRYRKENIELFPRHMFPAEVNRYFNNADIIITPRIDNLNSGVVFLGFTFGKTVIGPAIGNIKEFLEINGNPTFIPENTDSIVSAMKKAIEIREETGIRNKAFSDQELNPVKIAKEHYLLYKNLQNP